MNSFYQQYLTDKSLILLNQLRKKYQFTLIGGWAVYLYTQALKSKDIDIIVDFAQLKHLKKDFSLDKNERLKKYQIKIEEIDIDIYLPFYSDLGMPVENLIKKTTVVEGFTLPEKETLLITKLTAYKNRKASAKGQKDLIDIISLVLLADFDFEYFSSLVKKFHLKDYSIIIKKILYENNQIQELNLNRHGFAKKKKELLRKINGKN